MTETACDTNTVTPLRQRMEEQLRIANLAASTSKAYICEIKNLARYYDASPDELDAEQVRHWYLGRIDKGLSPGTTNVSFAALNFLYIDTLVLLPQRRDLLLRVPRSPGSSARPALRRRRGLAQPRDLLAQGHDRAALARLDTGLRKELLKARHFGLQREGILRRAADFPDLLLGRTQLGPAGVELRLQGTRPRPRLQLRTAQVFTPRFGRLRARPLSFVKRLPVAGRAQRLRMRGRPSPGVALGQRQVCPEILVANRHTHDASAWPE